MSQESFSLWGNAAPERDTSSEVSVKPEQSFISLEDENYNNKYEDGDGDRGEAGDGVGDDGLSKENIDHDKVEDEKELPSPTISKPNETAASELAHLGEDAFHTIEKNLSENKPLAFFVLFSIFCAAMLSQEIYQEYLYGWPPTELSKQASLRSTYASYCFIATAIFGFILLSCKISSLILGLLYMFLVVLVINYGMLSISRGVVSLLREDFQSAMEHLIFVESLHDNQDQDFYDKIQQIHKCCGWGTDVTESWPLIYKSMDMVDSCCVKKVPGCGRDAGKGRIEKPSSGYTILVPNGELDAFTQNGVVSLSYGVGYHPMEESLKALFRPDLEPNTVEDYVDSAGKRILKNKLDHKELRKIDYAQTEIEYVHPGITHMWDVTSKDLQDVLPDTTLLYFSKGLIETTLFLDRLHHKRCEQIQQKQGYSDDIPRLTAAYPHYNFYMGFVKIRMQYAIGFSSALIVMIIILAVFFWSYFSKLKSEEMADLSPPTDFDLLNLQLPTYGEVDELRARRKQNAAQAKQQAINLEREIAHILVAEKLAQVYEEEVIAKQTVNTAEGEGNVELPPELPAESWAQPKLLVQEETFVKTPYGRRPTIHELINLSRNRRKNKVVPDALIKPHHEKVRNKLQEIVKSSKSTLELTDNATKSKRTAERREQERRNRRNRKQRNYHPRESSEVDTASITSPGGSRIRSRKRNNNKAGKRLRGGMKAKGKRMPRARNEHPVPSHDSQNINKAKPMKRAGRVPAKPRPGAHTPIHGNLHSANYDADGDESDIH